MSVSTSSGGIPEKKVATTTSGKLMGGNRSTGMRAKLVIPITTSARQITTMKYGFRMEKRDTVYFVSSCPWYPARSTAFG